MSERNSKLGDSLREDGLRELRLLVTDARSAAVRRRLATECAALSPADELDTLSWIEAISVFDERDGEPASC